MARITPKTRPHLGRVARAKRSKNVPAKAKKAPRPNDHQIPRKPKKAEGRASSYKGELNSYFSDIGRGERQLTPTEELELNKQLQDSVHRTTKMLIELLKQDHALLNGASKPRVSKAKLDVLRGEASLRMSTLNPDQLSGKALQQQLLNRFFNFEGLNLLKTYDPKDGGAVAERMIKANLLLVVSVARKYYRPGTGTPFSELIQEGNIGLIKGVMKYDYRRGNRFSTYATWWIRHAITRSVADNGREIRVPVHMIEFIQTINRVRAALTSKLGRTPTIEEIAEQHLANKRAGAKDKPPASPEAAAKERAQLIGKLHKMSVQTQLPVSLHSIVRYDSDDTELGDLVPAEGPEELKPWAGLEDGHLQRALETLRPIEQVIVHNRFGFTSEDGVTLRELGEKYNLSRERIRQLQAQALRKLKKALAPLIAV